MQLPSSFPKCILIAFSFLIFKQSIAQDIHDKEAFRNAFARIFETRANWMDSIVIDSDADEYEVSVKFPGADECSISDNGIYVALYKFKDSIQANQYFKELQGFLNYAAGAYNARMRFKQINNDPYYLQYYISDSLGYIESYSTLSLYTDEIKKGDDDDNRQKTKTPGKFFVVNMTMDDETEYNYFTSAGEKKNDTAVTRLIKDVAFGKDPQMALVKTDKKTVENGVTVYGSRRTLNGYTAEIAEEEYNKAIQTTLQLTHSFTGTGDQLLKKAEELLLNIKAALPGSYCYTIDGQTVYFLTHPFANSSPDAILKMEYAIDEENENLMHLVLSISREKAKPN